MLLKKAIRSIISYFELVYFFEATKNSRRIYFKDLRLAEISSINKIKNNDLKKYLKKKNITTRFNKNTKLYVLFYKKLPVSLGWYYKGNSWNISEIQRKINIKYHIMLFDFYTFPNFRNNGFYKKLLLLIRNKNFKKKFMIYCSLYNSTSKKGIIGAGFNFVYKLKRI